MTSVAKSLLTLCMTVGCFTTADSIVKSTTEPCQYSEMLHIYAASAAPSVRVNSYFPPQPRGANFEADMLSHNIRRAGISQSPHSTNNDNYMNWPMTGEGFKHAKSLHA